MTRQISLKDIKIDDKISPRDGIDADIVKQYAEVFEELPPIVVFNIKEDKYLLADGFHRFRAAQRNKLSEVVAVVKSGTFNDAWEFALLANVKHGKPLNGKERKRVVEGLLQLHTERADNWIAKDSGVTTPTIRTIREKLEAALKILKLDKFIGQDGKWYPREHGDDKPENPKLELCKTHNLDALDGLRKLDPDSVQLVFTDPPYNIGVDYGFDGQDSLPEYEYYKWCGEWFKEIVRVLENGASFYVMHYPEVCSEWKKMLDPLLTFRRWITWHYHTNIGHGKANWTRSQRTILFYTKGDKYTFNALADAQPYKNPKDRRVRFRGQEGTTPYDVWEYDLVKNVSKQKTTWPNQIPVALVSRIVLTSSNEGDLVFDPFMGSGTTAEASHINRRKWIGFDTNPESATITEGRTK